jgi:hypothetical protein
MQRVGLRHPNATELHAGAHLFVHPIQVGLLGLRQGFAPVIFNLYLTIDHYHQRLGIAVSCRYIHGRYYPAWARH